MLSNNVEAQPTLVSMFVYSFAGLTCLLCVYGILGTLLTILQFFRLGKKRFFELKDRPSPPSKATDRIYGNHEMIKLKSSGISLHYVSKGLPNQPMILFVHGFPECWYSWRNQMKYFSKDYRVVAIDQRGYGVSSKPSLLYEYKIETLASDVADVIEQLGYESCVLVGHDIGGLVAWTTAMLYPHLIEKLIIMNSPHPVAFRQQLSWAQIRRLWYMFFCHSPLIPEMLFRADDFAIFKQIFLGESIGAMNKDSITDEDIEVYKYTFSQKGTTKAAINYFRALFLFQSDFSHGVVSAPVLLLWGCQDPILDEELADASQQYCPNIQVKKIPNATHWINQDIPDIVNKYMEVFLNDNGFQQYTYDF